MATRFSTVELSVGEARSRVGPAVAGVAYDEHPPDWSDDEITLSAERLATACWAIVDAPQAQTPAGLALKAAASMNQFRSCFGGCWPGDREEMAWSLLSELAGDAYVPPILPARLRALNEPGRA